MFEHIHLKKCDSTQSELKRRLEKISEFRPYLLSTEHQSQGYGRGGKAWVHTEKGLAFSFTFPSQKIATLSSLESSVLMCRFFKEQGHKCYIKWPNDLLTFDGQKFAGTILHQSHNFFIVGIGVNLSDSPNLVRTHFPSGSLHSPNKSVEIDKSEYPKKIYQYFLKNHYESQGQLLEDWKKFCFHLNMEVYIQDGNSKISGVFLGVDKFGRALLQTKQQDILAISNGSLFLGTD